MKENIILMVVPAAAVVIILLLKDRISDTLRRRRNPPEKVEGEIRARLLQTDWASSSEVLQRAEGAATGVITKCLAFLLQSDLNPAVWKASQAYGKPFE